MDPKKLLAEKMAEVQTIRAKIADPALEFTEEDADAAAKLADDIDELRTKIDKADAVSKRLEALPSFALPVEKSGGAGSEVDTDDELAADATAGDRFIASDAYKAFKAANPRGISVSDDSVKVDIKVKNLEPKQKAILRRPTTGNARSVRTNQVDDLVFRAPRTLLDVITTGTTDLPWFQYRQIIAKSNNADIVPEASSTTLTTTASGYKPVSDLTTTTAEAREFTYADGMEVTNQELTDDGIMRSIIDSTLRENLQIKKEAVLLNSVASAEAPAGIMTTSGVLSQAYVPSTSPNPNIDVPKTLRKAITKLRVTSGAQIRGVLMNPLDDELFDLLQDSHGDWLAGPYSPGPATVWGYERIVSQAIPQGKALIGDFSTIHLLQYTPLEVLAFNQHADFARRNMTYVRAEERALQLIRNAAKLCIVNLTV